MYLQNIIFISKFPFVIRFDYIYYILLPFAFVLQRDGIIIVS